MNTKDRSGLLAATSHFPAHAAEIEAMMQSDEDFRGLCGDLAEAEGALVGSQRLPEPVREERRLECRSWIDGLSAEIEAALRQKKVISIAGARRKPAI